MGKLQLQHTARVWLQVVSCPISSDWAHCQGKYQSSSLRCFSQWWFGNNPWGPQSWSGIHITPTALRGGSSLVSIGNISEQGPRPLLINIHDCSTINRKLVVIALTQHWWGHWWLMTQIAAPCIPGDEVGGHFHSHCQHALTNRYPGSLWRYLHLLRRKLELQEIKLLAHYWLKSEAELGFNPKSSGL